MKYNEYNDYELVDLIAESNENAEKIIYEKYRPLVIYKAKKFYSLVKNTGVDMNDLIQEGYIGLSQALKDYKDNRSAQFKTFANLCIEREMISFVKTLHRMKHQALNESITVHFNKNTDNMFIDFISDEESDPMNYILDKEKEKELAKIIDEKLTDNEKQIYNLRIANFTYQEIADLLDLKKKSVDNYLQKIKQKIKTSLSEYNK